MSLVTGYLHHGGTDDPALCLIALLQDLRDRAVLHIGILDTHDRLMHVRVEGLPLRLNVLKPMLFHHLAELRKDHLHALLERLAV